LPATSKINSVFHALTDATPSARSHADTVSNFVHKGVEKFKLKNQLFMTNLTSQ